MWFLKLHWIMQLYVVHYHYCATAAAAAAVTIVSLLPNVPFCLCFHFPLCLAALPLVRLLVLGQPVGIASRDPIGSSPNEKDTSFVAERLIGDN